MKLTFYLITPPVFALFSAAKTLVTLSSKEKDSLGTGAGPSTLGLGIDSSSLEPGTRLHRLTY
jgi:hypothetical protein